jgi:hypothetical protein
MAVEITVPGLADLPWAFYHPRVTAGLRGFYILGGTLADSLINHSPGGAALTVTGLPVINSNHARVTSLSNFFATGLLETQQYTYLAVAKTAATPTGLIDAPLWVGNFAGGTVATRGASLYAAFDGQVRSLAGAGGDNGGVSTTNTSAVAADVTAWRMLFAGANATTNFLRDETANLGDSDPIVGVRAAPTVNPLRLGSGYATFAGVGDLAVAGIWDRWLTDAERAAMTADIRVLLTARGIAGV